MSPLPYRLCAIDLDDTLLNAAHRISPRNDAAVRAVIAQGVIVVVASGRTHESALRYAEELALETPIISYNGSMVKHPCTQEVWKHESVASDLAEVVLDYCTAHNLQLNWYLNDRVYTAADTPWWQLYQRRTLVPYEICPDLENFARGTTPTKLVIVDSPEFTNGLLPYFQEQLGDRLYITKTTAEYLEFMPLNANKGSALELVAHRFGFTAAETIAFGDNDNDIPMVKWAGLGVAVANARPRLLEVADKIAPRYDEDGVAVTLAEIFGG